MCVSGEHILCELYRGSAGERPGRPLSDVARDVALVLVSQEVEREAHRGEVDLLQQPVGAEGSRAVSGSEATDASDLGIDGFFDAIVEKRDG